MKEAYEQLEDAFAEKYDTHKGAVACSSGSSALLLALQALRLPPGSEVIVPTFTMVACARAVRLAGLIPVFVDSDNDGLMDWRQVKHAISGDTSAIMPVHIYGQQYPIGALGDVIYNKGIAIVEDLAEAHGIPPSWESAAVCWSFYKNKIVASEEGGMVSFKNGKHAELARQLRNHGFTPAHDFKHVPGGWNHRLANCLAVKALESFKQLRNSLSHRGHRWFITQKFLPGWFPPKVHWVYVVKGDPKLVKDLNSYGIQARHLFYPLHLQEEFKDYRYFGSDVALGLYNTHFYVPLNLSLAELEMVRLKLATTPLQGS